MELSHETAKYLMDIGIVAVGHIGIFANRLRSGRNKLDVYLEHVVSHTLRPMFYIGVMGLMNSFPETKTAGFGVLCGVGSGIYYDGVWPAIKEKTLKAIQWDQLAANLLGTAIFVALTQVIR